MKGIKHVEVSNRNAKFKFDLYRNITIVKGDSGTGKTTLYQMIADYMREGPRSGVNLSSPIPCVALENMDWETQLKNTADSIVFIDEGISEVRTEKFASTIKNTDNYYVIFCRDNLHELPYSVEEIYEIKSSGKQHTFKHLYVANDYHVYGRGRKPRTGGNDFNTILTEDAKSGYQFFDNYCSCTDISCESAGSNSEIYKWLIDKSNNDDTKVYVVADGAAFGAEIERVMGLQKFVNFKLCLPESFEWMILRSGIVEGVNKNAEINQILENPSEYMRSGDFFSWEKYFEKLLRDSTADTPIQYSKSKINPQYISDANQEKIIRTIINIADTEGGDE